MDLIEIIVDRPGVDHAIKARQTFQVAKIRIQQNTNIVMGEHELKKAGYVPPDTKGA